MNLHVPPELDAKLTRLAAETGRTADQVALDLLTSSMDHDEWLRAEVEKGRAAAGQRRLLEHDDVAARMDGSALSRLMRVRWTTDAADDLERICDYIA
jgi:predicted transcriptional regulator